jgi:hypothetical protein
MLRCYRSRSLAAGLSAGVVLAGASPAFAIIPAGCSGSVCNVTISADPGTTSSVTLSYALAYANSLSTPVTINITTNFSSVTNSYAGKGVVRYAW